MGVISFRFPLFDVGPRPFPLSTNDVLIAPFWDFIETFFGGRVFFRQTNDEDLLTQVGTATNEAFMVDFSPTLMLIVTWDRVPTGPPFDVCSYQLGYILHEWGKQSYHS